MPPGCQAVPYEIASIPVSSGLPITSGSLDAINQAIASGSRSVSYNGKSITYNSFDDLLRARSFILRELGQVDNAAAAKHIRMQGRKTST